MPIWQLCANLLIPNCLRSNLSYSPLAALELYVTATTTNSYLYFLNLIEKKHTQFLVEAIEIQHLLESCTIFILMSFLWNFQ